jgi:hypothetical protein
MLMLKLMIECSRTGRLIETGIETDRRSFQMLTKKSFVTPALSKDRRRW